MTSVSQRFFNFYSTVSMTFKSPVFVFKRKKKGLCSSHIPRKIHASCERSKPFHGGSSSFHVQEKNPRSGKKSILAKA